MLIIVSTNLKLFHAIFSIYFKAGSTQNFLDDDDDVSLFSVFSSRDHPLSTYARFSEKLIFLPPDTQTYVCVSG